MRDSDLRILQLLLVEPGLTTTELRLRGGYNRSEVLESKGWIKFKKNPPAKEWALTGSVCYYAAMSTLQSTHADCESGSCYH